MLAEKIAILGWGSLIWDARPDFDRYLKPWNSGGPRLPLEFSRKSTSRKNALTMVIDSDRGTNVQTLYALSKRRDPRDAVCDLRSREGTTIENVGLINCVTGEGHCRDANAKVVKVIRNWAKAKNIQVVIWTDLEVRSPFSEQTRNEFCDAALAHLKSLDLEGTREAVQYIVMAHEQIKTHFRRLLMKDQWFKQQVAIYKDA